MKSIHYFAVPVTLALGVAFGGWALAGNHGGMGQGMGGMMMDD